MAASSLPFKSRNEQGIWGAIYDATMVDQSGIGMCPGYFDEADLSAIRREAARVKKLSRRIGEWVNTRRTTLIPVAEVELLRHRPFSAEFWAPHTKQLTDQFAWSVKRVGAELTVPELQAWTPTRIGFNYMNGSPDDPAIIPAHIDPERESGLVAVVDLDQDNGDVHLIIGADVCRQFDIVQPVHEVQAESERTSLTIANLRPSGREG